jgi:hypothetical protein
MSNVLVTTSVIAKEGVAILENMLNYAKGCNRDWEGEFSSNKSRGYAPGTTINIPKPPRYVYRSGRVAVPQSTTETTVPLTLQQGGVEINFTSAETTLSLARFEQKLQSAMATIANEVDRQGLMKARQDFANAIGGSLPNSQATALAVATGINRRLDDMGAPRDKQRSLVMGTGLNEAMIQGLAGLFNSSSKISEQYGSGMMVDSLGLNVAMDQNVDSHLNGSANVTTNTVNGAGQSGSTITVNALNGTITKGSKISFANVFAVNPQSRTSTGVLAQFTVTADAASSATSISISPALTPSGPFQNVTASPANSAGITIFGTASTAYTANVGFHRDAVTLAMVPLWMPEKGVVSAAQESYKGFNLRVIETYDGIQDVRIMRMDVLFGYATPYPELGVVYGT